VSAAENAHPVRPGVRVPRGATFVIPAGALRISIGDDGMPAMEVTHVQAAVQTWPDWLSIAFTRLGDVKAARRRMIGAVAAGDDAAETASLTEEFQASLQAIAAAVFGLDAFYGVICEMVNIPDAEKDARRRAGRAVWVADAIGRASRMPNDVRKTMSENVHTAYGLRDGAVHPPFLVEPYAIHPGLNQAVPQFYSHYTLELSHGAVSWAAEAIMWVVDRPQPRNPAVCAYAIGASDLLHAVVDEHLTYDPEALVGRRPPGSEGDQRVGP
jgi:hypothetical protein